MSSAELAAPAAANAASSFARRNLAMTIANSPSVLDKIAVAPRKPAKSKVGLAPLRHVKPSASMPELRSAAPKRTAAAPAGDPVAKAAAAQAAKLVTRMVDAVSMQADAICELCAYRQGPVDRGLRAQGGWETVRVTVSHASDDTAAEAAALAQRVWPELRARCVARRLHLVAVDARGAREAEALEPSACMLQLEAAARCNEGSPFLLVVRGAKAGWVPPVESLATFGDRWVHGLSLGSMEAFDVVCRRRGRSVAVLSRASPAAAPARLRPRTAG